MYSLDIVSPYITPEKNHLPPSPMNRNLITSHKNHKDVDQSAAVFSDTNCSFTIVDVRNYKQVD